MLDEATIEWLERRKSVEDFCCTICDWERDEDIDGGFCWPKEEFFHDRDVREMKPCCCKGDYKDAAEFNARVAAIVGRNTVRYGVLLWNALFCNGRAIKYEDIPEIINDYFKIDLADILRYSQLAVEAEMIREGKGPGSPEDA